MNRAMRRPGGNWSAFRPDKLADHQTVLYEADMLRFAYGQITKPRPEARNADVWVYLEAFLLHYRKLLEFFGGNSRFNTDLTITRPDFIWSEKDGLSSCIPPAVAIEQMRRVGLSLWAKYEDSTKTEETISRYLQHCTTFRTSFKEWFVVEMFKELEEPIMILESHLPEFKPATNSGPVDQERFLGGTSVSTQS